MKFEPNYNKMITQREWKRELADWLGGMPFTHAITLVWNRSVDLPRARAHLAKLTHDVDRKLLGSRFHKTPAEFRTNAVFMFEGQRDDHVHVHSLWQAPPKKWFEFGKMFPQNRGGIWNTVVPSGTYDAVHFSPDCNNAEIVGYVLKKQHVSSESDLMVWSSEFHRSR